MVLILIPAIWFLTRSFLVSFSVAVPPEMMAPPREEVLNPLHGPCFQFDPKTFTVWVRPPMMLGIMPNSRTRVGCSFHGIGMQGQDAAGVSTQIKEYFPEVRAPVTSVSFKFISIAGLIEGCCVIEGFPLLVCLVIYQQRRFDSRSTFVI
jgi:hypothetical protein